MKTTIPTFALSFLCLSPSSLAFSPSQLIHRLKKTGTFSTTTTPAKNNDLIILLAAKVGIFFGTSTGNTQNVADMIAQEFGDDAEGPFDIDEFQGGIAKKFGEYNALVVGTPTWNTGADTERSGTGWDEIYYGEMQDLNLQGKKVAVFGLGDQVSYSENYADASGELHDVFEKLGCKMMGYTSQEGYEHASSKAIRGDLFCGLLCDEINQDDLSEERVQNWVAQLRSDGFLEEGAVGGSINTEVVIDTFSQSDIDELKKENAELRMMLAENSKLMDEVMSTQGKKETFTPHYNPRKGVTMWTSVDGRQCYYTSGAPKNP